MSISPFFTDDELCSQLRLQFPPEQQCDADFKIVFNRIVDRGVDFFLEFRGKQFSIDKLTGCVTCLNDDSEYDELEDDD